MVQPLTTAGMGDQKGLGTIGLGVGLGPRSGVGSGVPGGVNQGSGIGGTFGRELGVGKPSVGYANVAVAAARPGPLARGLDSALKTANDITAINRTAIAATRGVLDTMGLHSKPTRVRL